MKNFNQMQFQCNMDVRCDAYRLEAFKRDFDGNGYLLDGLTFKETEPMTVTPDTGVEFSVLEAQALIDALWVAGLRPSKKYNYHEADGDTKEVTWMRSLVDRLVNKGDNNG